jgi:hypothetical protein
MKPGLCILLTATFLFFACSQFVGRVPESSPDPRTRELFDTLKNINGSLSSFKGIGKIKIWNNRKITLNERVAWVGSKPLNFRIEVLFSGRPLIKVASDGEWLYYRNTNSDSHPYGQLRLTETNLERLLSIQISPDDLMAILSGRIPICNCDTAALIENAGGSGHILKLSKNRQGVVEQIYLDPKMQSVRQVELFDRSGRLKYRITFERVKTFDAYRAPGRLVVSADSGDRLQLDIQHFQTDIPTRASMFFLPPP